jgi:hypothetical protein|eukprot:COSAG01_NODE_15165_length_1366_cov_2.752170_3_plen_99_part_00
MSKVHTTTASKGSRRRLRIPPFERYRLRIPPFELSVYLYQHGALCGTIVLTCTEAGVWNFNPAANARVAKHQNGGTPYSMLFGFKGHRVRVEPCLFMY